MALRVVSHPVLCNYYLTYRCNAACSFCDIWEKPSPYATLAQVESNLQALRRLGVQVVDFTGGEPLLHRQLPEFLHLAKQLGLLTTVTTNGLLYPKQAQRLAGRVDMLHFSLDHPERAQHDACRGVACYDHLLRSLDIAQGLGERPDILYTVTNANVDAIGQVIERFTAPRGLVLILNPLFAYGEVGGSLDPAHFDTLRRWARQPGVYLNEAFLQLREQGGNRTERPVCAAASTTLVISPANELLLPCYHLGVHAIALTGHAAGALDAVWRLPATQALIALEGRLPQCEGCAINCYMQPSFATRVNRYFWAALPSTLKYAWTKWGPGLRPGPYRLPAPLPPAAAKGPVHATPATESAKSAALSVPVS